MRVNSVSSVYSKSSISQSKKSQNKYKQSDFTKKNNNNNQPSFKGLKGAGIGSVITGIGCLLGTGAIAIATISNPIGWGAAAALYFGSVATSAAGGYAGHKIEEKFFSDKNKKKK